MWRMQRNKRCLQSRPVIDCLQQLQKRVDKTNWRKMQDHRRKRFQGQALIFQFLFIISLIRLRKRIIYLTFCFYYRTAFNAVYMEYHFGSQMFRIPFYGGSWQSIIEYQTRQIIQLTMNKILLPEFPGNNLLFHAVSNSNAIDSINLLENKEADVNCRNVNGCTPLHIAIMNQNTNLVKVLLKYGADPNAKQYNDVGQKTPLHYAVEKNNYELSILLLDNGANPTLGDKRGLTVLHYAARFGFMEIVKLLLKYGADINLRDSSGFNAAHWAKLNEFPGIVELIGPSRCINPNDYQEYKKAMIEIHQIKLKKKKKKGKKKK